MPTLARIYALIERSCGVRVSELAPGADLERDLHITGDDFIELMERYSQEFSVNLQDYRWYFHHAEEVTFNPGALLFKPPYRLVNHIPVTPKVLLEAAETGHWTIRYPEHSLPKRRYDILASYGLLALGGIAIALILTRGKSGA
jgi:Protein of unknown function (DUF1493)